MGRLRAMFLFFVLLSCLCSAAVAQTLSLDDWGMSQPTKSTDVSENGQLGLLSIRAAHSSVGYANINNGTIVGAARAQIILSRSPEGRAIQGQGVATYGSVSGYNVYTYSANNVVASIVPQGNGCFAHHSNAFVDANIYDVDMGMNQASTQWGGVYQFCYSMTITATGQPSSGWDPQKRTRAHFPSQSGTVKFVVLDANNSPLASQDCKAYPIALDTNRYFDTSTDSTGQCKWNYVPNGTWMFFCAGQTVNVPVQVGFTVTVTIRPSGVTMVSTSGAQNDPPVPDPSATATPSPAPTGTGVAAPVDPNSTNNNQKSWWQDLFTTLFVPQTSTLQAWKAFHDQLAAWGPVGYVNTVWSTWTTRTTSVQPVFQPLTVHMFVMNATDAGQFVLNQNMQPSNGGTNVGTGNSPGVQNWVGDALKNLRDGAGYATYGMFFLAMMKFLRPRLVL